MREKKAKRLVKEFRDKVKAAERNRVKSEEPGDEFWEKAIRHKKEYDEMARTLIRHLVDWNLELDDLDVNLKGE